MEQSLWEFYEVSTVDSSKAKCKICSFMISRGGKASVTYNTSNMIKLLEKMHVEQWVAWYQYSYSVSVQVRSIGIGSIGTI